MSRAIVFDLDQTLYSERRFALSGFAAVAREVERTFGIPSREAFSVLRSAMSTGRREVALQLLCRAFGLPMRLVEELRWRIRTHTPALKLPKESAAVLQTLRADWRLGILTNGLPVTQMNKVSALGLLDKVDAIVYAEETSAGKPAPSAFEAIVRRLDVRPSDTVFVGDDPWCDVFGARRAGMKTIRLQRRLGPAQAFAMSGEADAVVGRLGEVPGCARALVGDVETKEALFHAMHS